jgi:hypothetical protein
MVCSLVQVRLRFGAEEQEAMKAIACCLPGLFFFPEDGDSNPSATSVTFYQTI